MICTEYFWGSSAFENAFICKLYSELMVLRANPSSHDGVWREGGRIKTPPSPQQKASKIQINIKTVLCVSKIR